MRYRRREWMLDTSRSTRPPRAMTLADNLDERPKNCRFALSFSLPVGMKPSTQCRSPVSEIADDANYIRSESTLFSVIRGMTHNL
jgi:hypothetical protein